MDGSTKWFNKIKYNSFFYVKLTLIQYLDITSGLSLFYDWLIDLKSLSSPVFSPAALAGSFPSSMSSVNALNKHIQSHLILHRIMNNVVLS